MTDQSGPPSQDAPGAAGATPAAAPPTVTESVVTVSLTQEQAEALDDAAWAVAHFGTPEQKAKESFAVLQRARLALRAALEGR